MIIDDIKKEMMSAKMEKDTLKANLLSALYAEIYSLSKTGKESGDDDAIKVIKKFIKNAEETLMLNISDKQKFKLAEEKKIMETYLPAQLTGEQIDNEVKQLIAEGKQMKDIMAYFKQNYAGRYNGKIVNERIKELTNL